MIHIIWYERYDAYDVFNTKWCHVLWILNHYFWQMYVLFLTRDTMGEGVDTGIFVTVAVAKIDVSCILQIA